MPATIDALDLPFEEAISFFRDKTNTPTKTWTDVYAAAHSHSFMVAGAASNALLDDFRSEILKALEKGTTLADFREGFDGIVQKHGWEYKGKRGWRSRIIFETNLRTAYSAGRFAQQTKPETLEAFPYWQYHHSGAIHPRREHLAWDGLVMRADNPFWLSNYPPNGWHCGCFCSAVSRDGLKRMGKSSPDEGPELLFRAEEVGGKRREVPFGVDPGFEYNPGRSWLTGGRPHEPIATPHLVQAFGRDALLGNLPIGATVPVAEVPAATLTQFGLEEGIRARMSAETLLGHADRPEIGAEVYAAAAKDALAAGLFEGERGRVSGIVTIDGKPHVVGFKVTRNGEFLVTTVHRSRAARIERILKTWKRVAK
ncbi:hypothetical protein DYI37_11450 [Fulvimarina endophytica]|uniref:Phage head morphogenesis domain-containing protein n=1 Tax=Fulvimarina endophytica TaxID=2293836 RepID=A0A371X319_9HYPH|nr:phage minor head protein [Fulvimarina endophytica]RFC63613.1 hypothetical protein DYI37_11450 [Fulvimarina endophytica]